MSASGPRIYTHLARRNRDTSKKSIPFDLQAQLALLWKLLTILRHSPESNEIMLDFFADLSILISDLPPFSLSTAWESNADVNNVVGVPDTDGKDIPYLSSNELTYLNDDDNTDSFESVEEHDPLHVVRKLYDAAENLSSKVSSKDRAIALDICLKIAIKSGRCSLMLRVASLLLSEDSHYRDISVKGLSDLRNFYLSVHQDSLSSGSGLSLTSHSLSKHVLSNFAIPKPMKLADFLKSSSVDPSEDSLPGGMLLTFGKADHGKLGHGDAQVKKS